MLNRVANNAYDAKVKSKSPAVNIKEDENQFEIEFRVPGYTKEQFKISNHEGKLTVKAQVNNTESTDNYTRHKFGSYSFDKVFNLPDNVNIDAIEASYVDGILKLGLPKIKMSVETKNVEILVH
jgi:HSP20 family protein